ncbi:MAG TPA: hypothetical protein VNX28_05460 [Gemmataceae bacterium]|jgi:hypothetical protein|nr:hypothetical protein [Gemmataceae bacterium]
MNPKHCFACTVIGLLALIGCTESPSTVKPNSNSSQAKVEELAPELKTKIQTALAKLSDADRPLAQAQKFCPVQKGLLGTMGKPDRIEIEGQPVFLCCWGCADDARADPKKTLHQVALFKKEK